MSPSPPEPAGEHLLLIDGHSLAYRAYYALPVENFTTSTGQPTNAVYGFTSMLLAALAQEQPTHLAVAFDRPAPTFRHEAFPAYKATRRSTPEDFRPQVELIRELLAALRIQVVEATGFEADDVIATLATQAAQGGLACEIVTGDRDALQLVDDRITVLMTRRGISELTRYTPQEVQERYGLSPTQYPDFAALRGDPSDNLPSVPGVGEKTAARLVRSYGSLEAVLAHLDEVPGRVGESLREHQAEVLHNRELTELVRDVPLPVSPTQLRRHPPDREALEGILAALQFRSLRGRLDAVLRAPEASPADERAPEAPRTQPAVAVRSLRPGEVGAWLRTHAWDGSRVGVEFVAQWARGHGDVTAIGLSSADAQSAVVDPAALPAEDLAELATWLDDPGVPKAAHDVKEPLLGLRARGLNLAGLTSDTALAAYLVSPGQAATDLASLARRYTDVALENPAGPGSLRQEELPLAGPKTPDSARPAHRASAIRELADALDGELAERGALRLLRDLELPLVAVLAGMEEAGIAVDTDLLASLSDRLGAAVAAVAREAWDCVGHEFNLGSPKQVQAVLFTELKLPKTKRIKTGFTTDAEALVGLAARTEHPLPRLLLRHRDVARLKTVVDGLIPLVGDDGRIHTTFHQTIAATGRLSSTEPNLQNIPVRTAEGREIRQAFVVGSGYDRLLTADYSQIEMRILAHLAGDAELIAAFRGGEDVHTTTAALVFGVPRAAVDPEQRRRVKAMSYGLAYGLSAFGLAGQLGISPDEAREQIQTYFARFSAVRAYLSGVVERARRDGYTETLLGRRRYLPDLSSENAQRRAMAERMALNAPIQGSAADIIKLAMLGVHRELGRAQLSSRVLLQVHDELVIEVAPGELASVEALVRAQMAGAIELSVPLDVTLGVGRNWDEAGH